MQGSQSRVQVSVRIRPPVVSSESSANDKVVIHKYRDDCVVVECKNKETKNYKFDHVFSSDDGQARVFETLGAPMLQEAYEGFNVCLFAYGQTGSGKTYSLLADSAAEEEQGLAPRFVRQLFAEAQRRVEEDGDLTVKVSVSMIEVYMERVRDLLSTRARGQEPESLEIHEDPNRRVYVKGAGKHIVMSAERLLELLRRGNANRQVAETRMNETSSRSHAIVQITLSQEYDSLTKKDLECCISLVDLAGSERQTKTESAGQSFEEAKKINHSLLMLGRALNSFSDRKGGGDAYVSLRESKLTRLLSESFGGNSKTWMLATVSPTVFNLTETISTLEYASNAMAITNKVRINKTIRDLEYNDMVKLRTYFESTIATEERVIADKDATIAELRDTIESLSAELSQFSDTQVDDQLQEALFERRRLVTALRAALRQSGAPEHVCFSGVCKCSIAHILFGSTEKLSLVVPTYDLSGPPPILSLSVTIDANVEEDVVVSVLIHEAVHFPDFALAGAAVSVWFEGQSESKVRFPVVSPNGGNPVFNVRQTFVFGPLTEYVQRYFQSDVLYVQLEGLI